MKDRALVETPSDKKSKCHPGKKYRMFFGSATLCIFDSVVCCPFIRGAVKIWLMTLSWPGRVAEKVDQR